MQEHSEFWTWFGANEARFRNIEVENKETLLDELQESLHNYCSELWFETGCAADGINELVISAEGDLDYFSAVRTLVATAPDIAGWRFIAFKPAVGFDFSISYAGMIFDPGTAWFLPLRSSSDPTSRGVRVGYAHFERARSADILAGTFLLLDSALGELQFAEQVHHVEVGALPSSPESSGYVPLKDLDKWLRS